VFDGTSGFIDFGLGSVFDSSDRDLIIVAKVKPANLSGSKCIVGQFKNATTERKWKLGLSDSTPAIYMRGVSSNTSFTFSNSNLVSDRWSGIP